mmetsp:Transcript_4491/g.10140  ORF Transcript_4491/g.10140 Transcript_4491/m.10140 type:complete len:1850 (-) Transcript_4491:1250-6799(-)
MNSATSLNPKKLKVILTSLRDAISTLSLDTPTKDADATSKKSSSASTTKATAFSLLLVSELASRGVGIALPQNYNTNNAQWIISLLESIRSVAGKVAIDDVAAGDANSGYPAPMMAALNAASGMAASACSASSVLGNDLDSLRLLLPMEDETVREAALDTLKRCQEVNDGRFYTLLKLAHDVYSSETENNDSSQMKKMERRQRYMQQLKHHFNTIAYANYLYGATNFAKDQPPMWKRCLDAALENTSLAKDILSTANNSGSGSTSSSSTSSINNYKSYQNSQTILPLQNMIRIAQSKGNEKRIKELSLFLSVGYSGGVQERLERMKKESSGGGGGSSSSATVSSSTNGKDKEGQPPKLNQQSMEQLLTTYYLHRTSTLVEMEDFSTSKTLLDLAKESLAVCDCPQDVTSENYESYLLYHYVQVQIEYLTEESNVWIDVQRQHRAMLNRRPEGGSSPFGSKGGGVSIGIGSKKAARPTATTKEEMECQTRSQVYLDAWNTWKSEPSSKVMDLLSSLALRDAVIQLSFLSPPTTASLPAKGWYASTDIVQDCYGSLLHQVEWLVEIAMTAQRHNRGKKGGNTAKEDASRVWQAVLSFVSPLVVEHLHPLVTAGNGDDSNATLLNTTLRRLMECCSEAIVSASWMCEPFSEEKDDGIYDLINFSQLLSMSYECLIKCQEQRLAEEKRLSEERKKETSVLSSQDKYSDLEKKELLQFQSALAALMCRMELDNAVNGSEASSELSMNALTAAARKATIAATTITKSSLDLKSSPSLSPSSSNAKFGAPYIQFLSAWSGMYHSPWPFCTLGQARTILRNAREALSVAGKVWGRDSSSIIEKLMLDVGEADLEGSLMGGFKNVSEKLYRQAMNMLEENEVKLVIYGSIKGMLKIHCLLGLAKLSLSSDSSDAVVAEDLARNALDILLSLDSSHHDEQSDSPVLLCMYAWSVPSLSQLSHSYHICVSRQLVADACIRSSRPEDARRFLTDAVKDFPGNFESAFALAAFHLRSMLSNMDDESEIKKTRTLLLKAAKMDTTKPDAFALLGVWYESSQNDASRAKGCYQKALAIDPSHPVAGRGLVRLTSLEKVPSFCEHAAKRNSPVNGWAWRVMGKQKSRGEGDDSTAVVCFQQALRCRDIQTPGSEILGAFYANPTASASSNNVCCEASETWAELAACYRQLGKYSAALRAYEAAYSVSDGNLSPDALCSWAQVDLDLGLYEEAADKCAKVLSLKSSAHVHRIAAYIEGEALLFLARSCAQEGKLGACLSYLEKGITRISALQLEEQSTKEHYCEVKLLGDLYSSGNSLPSYVFAAASPLQDKQQKDKIDYFSREVENQLSFLMKGEQAYTLALELGKEEDGNEEDSKMLMAAAATDLGTNLLSQARVVSMALGEGSGGGTQTASSELAMQSSQLKDLITRSVNAYLCAIDYSPHEASAWCGLGCALIAVDPLFSQHAFCRALQIDASLADSWSNIGLLYAKSDTEKCSEVLDYLTQVEDTPLMWIGRGFLLEKTSRAWKDQDLAREACLTKAADAYRAALQIKQHPAALLGLSLTCRRADPRLKESNDLVYSDLVDHASKIESRVSMVIHQNMTGEGNIGASYVSGLTLIEEGLNRLNNFDGSKSALIMEAKKAKEALNARMISKNEESSMQRSESEVAQCEMDLSVSMALHEEKTEEFPYDSIESVTDQAPTVSSSRCLDETSQSRNSCNILDEARNNVFLNPESGEAWLIFASQLAQELPSEINDITMLSSAKIAAKKAYDLLHDRVVHATLLSPKRQTLQGKSIEFSDVSVVSSLPPASLLSQSMSLVSWLEEAEALKNGDNLPVPERTFASLQEAFLLDPLNPIAAASLGLI